jgi:hypothetical protein
MSFCVIGKRRLMHQKAQVRLTRCLRYAAQPALLVCAHRLYPPLSACLAVCLGDIDFGEFKQMVYDGLLLEGAIQDYEDAFNAVDNSGNGSIGEACHYCAWLCCHLFIVVGWTLY